MWCCTGIKSLLTSLENERLTAIIGQWSMKFYRRPEFVKKYHTGRFTSTAENLISGHLNCAWSLFWWMSHSPIDAILVATSSTARLAIWFQVPWAVPLQIAAVARIICHRRLHIEESHRASRFSANINYKIAGSWNSRHKHVMNNVRISRHGIAYFSDSRHALRWPFCSSLPERHIDKPQFIARWHVIAVTWAYTTTSM